MRESSTVIPVQEKGKKKSTCCWIGRNLDASPVRQSESVWRKQAGGGAACRELSSAGGAETGTDSVQPSARNGGSGGGTSSRQSVGSHFLCSSDRFKHSECKEAFHISYQLWFPSRIFGSWMLAFKTRISLKSLPKRLDSSCWVIESSPLLVRDFFFPPPLRISCCENFTLEMGSSSSSSSGISWFRLSLPLPGIQGRGGSQTEASHSTLHSARAPLKPLTLLPPSPPTSLPGVGH